MGYYFDENTWINRNIVECKSVTYEKEYEENMELIETLWNVNKKDTVAKLATALELIETLWNVNRLCRIII